MSKNEITQLKNDIEDLREEVNRYIEYPDIFKEEIMSTSRRLDELINEYLKLKSMDEK